MSPKTVDAQREVVKNERRQSVENQPYGEASEVTLGEMLFPPDHPYHWPVIGYMTDLNAASYDDVVKFFETYYTTANASLVVAGDIDPAKTRALVEKWFADVKRSKAPPPLNAAAVTLTGVQKKTVTDRVQLPRLYLAWVTPPHFKPGDAALDMVSEVLAGGKNSRLYKRLVYDMQIAQNVFASQQSMSLASVFEVSVTPRPGHTIAEVQKVIDEELQKLQHEDPSAHEFERALNQIEASFYNRLERTGGFGGVADQMNAYYTETGNPDGFAADMARYRALKASDVSAAAAKYLPLDKRVELTVEPQK
jgi:zinc protease